MRVVVVHTDGYADEAHAGWAFVATGDLSGRGSGPLPRTPSHVVEWIAVHEALLWLEPRAQPEDQIELRSDSALVAKGLASRRPEMSGEAAQLRAACRQALARLGERGARVKVLRIPREANPEADALAREAARRATSTAG